jgi:hypothetical protein
MKRNDNDQMAAKRKFQSIGLTLFFKAQLNITTRSTRRQGDYRKAVSWFES